MVSDFSDSTPTAPPENLLNFMIDPRLVERFNHNNNNANQENAGGVAHDPLGEVANQNALAALALFESMLTSADYETREGDGMPQDNDD